MANLRAFRERPRTIPNQMNLITGEKIKLVKRNRLYKILNLLANACIALLTFGPFWPIVFRMDLFFAVVWVGRDLRWPNQHCWLRWKYNNQILIMMGCDVNKSDGYFSYILLEQSHKFWLYRSRSVMKISNVGSAQNTQILIFGGLDWILGKIHFLGFLRIVDEMWKYNDQVYIYEYLIYPYPWPKLSAIFENNYFPH